MSDVDELVSEVKELTRTLRGHNGYDGLLTEFRLLRQEVKFFSERIEAVNAEVQKIHLQGCNYRQKGSEATLQKFDKSLEDRAFTYKWVREKLVVPIIVAVIIGLINAIAIAKYIAPLFD